MAIRRLSGDCKDADWTCPGIWEDDDYPEDFVVVGPLFDPSRVPLGPDEGVIRISRQLVRDAQTG